jgi:hypothetical protein
MAFGTISRGRFCTLVACARRTENAAAYQAFDETPIPGPLGPTSA